MGEKDFRLSNTIARLSERGKGIMACDESPRSMGRRLESQAIEPTFQMREKFFSLLFETDGFGRSIAGVILFDDMLANQTLPPRCKDLLDAAGVLVGVRADQGLYPFPNYPDLGLASGIDSIRARLEVYAQAGASFVKWRAAFSGSERPGADIARKANASILALYALSAIEFGLVPIVEVEIEIDGNHTISECEDATKKSLRVLFNTLEEYEVDLRFVVLKTNFIAPGKDAKERVDAASCVRRTVSVLTEVVPTKLPLVAFLSGGHSADVAISLLADIARSTRPWAASFSFGRALWMNTLVLWAGKDKQIGDAQTEFAKIARRCSEAIA